MQRESKELIIKGQVINMTFDECYTNFIALKHMFLNKWKRFDVVDEEDKEQEINIALYAAYKRYDVKYGTEFVTSAYATINMYLMNMYRDLKREKRKIHYTSVSLDENISDDDTKKKIFGVDAIKYLEDYGSVEIGIMLTEKLSEKENKVLRLLTEGYTQQEIADIFGCSQVSVSRYKNKISEKLKAIS